MNAYNKEYKICACAPIDDSNQFGEYNIVFHLLELRISALREHKPMIPYVIEKFRTVKIINNLTGTVWRINFSGKIIYSAIECCKTVHTISESVEYALLPIFLFSCHFKETPASIRALKRIAYGKALAFRTHSTRGI